MTTLDDKGAELNLTMRTGCDFQFTIDVAPYDLTGAIVVMNIDFDDGTVNPLPPITPTDAFTIYVDIPNTVTSELPAKSRYIMRITEADGDVKPLVYGTITCLAEPA